MRKLHATKFLILEN